ncbi:helix-turn-helix domain-containing protein [Falsochrobactrum ovis]|uniref:helix-turn-helix domain-containing protein n=1 Tax=Falsochrobactrum ovis TaxID=1293442 RepID=UPI000DBA7794|nr:XRE family transcriptional regulator [Falsochrobactrum ovis]
MIVREGKQLRAPIGIKIRRRRLEIGLSQAGLAKEIGISPAYLNLIENNKRAIGGKLLLRIGERLQLSLAELSGASEARSIQLIEEMLADPLMKGISLDQNAIRDFVARFPEAAIALTRLYRSYIDAMASIDVYIHRLQSDPLLSELLHLVLNRIAAIKSGAEILASVPDLTDDEQKRFIGTINNESADLTMTVRNLVAYFERTVAQQKAFSPMAELDEAIISQQDHFPQLEELAEKLRHETTGPNGWDESTLIRALQERFGVRFMRVPRSVSMPEQHRFDPTTNEFRVRASATAATRLFQLARLYALKAAPEILEQSVDALELTSDEAKKLARGALASYVAGAMLMPYERFLKDATTWQYDIDLLANLYNSSFEQVAHRLVTLRRPGAEGLPFGFLRADRTGRLTKRLPISGLTLPVSGYGCALWPIYQAFGSERIVRQVAVFPGGGRFLLIAKSVSKRVSNYHEQPLVYSIMLAFDLIHADRTVYGQGLDLSHEAVPVGPSCLLCSRQDCSHRQEAFSSRVSAS